ncbi:hypothetical protein GCM10007209_17010 [Haloferax sulfurifontis]|uniref:Uncharacterized protein n=1 Tax=Haloferax sulfurifontis TaxID=255616 RepID=A0A830DSH1_9EURY|nr:hypothetical protein GCM10007209_17010 [Haloferax sulfurifontis]
MSEGADRFEPYETSTASLGPVRTLSRAYRLEHRERRVCKPKGSNQGATRSVATAVRTLSRAFSIRRDPNSEAVSEDENRGRRVRTLRDEHRESRSGSNPVPRTKRVK